MTILAQTANGLCLKSLKNSGIWSQKYQGSITLSETMQNIQVTASSVSLSVLQSKRLDLRHEIVLSLLAVCVFVCVFTCVHVCICSCMYVGHVCWMCVCVNVLSVLYACVCLCVCPSYISYMPEFITECLLWLLSSFGRRRVSHCTWGAHHFSSNGWPASSRNLLSHKPIYLPLTGLRKWHCAWLAFSWGCWGSKLKPSGSHSKHFSHWTISLVPDAFDSNLGPWGF